MNHNTTLPQWRLPPLMVVVGGSTHEHVHLLRNNNHTSREHDSCVGVAVWNSLCVTCVSLLGSLLHHEVNNNKAPSGWSTLIV